MRGVLDEMYGLEVNEYGWILIQVVAIKNLLLLCLRIPELLLRKDMKDLSSGTIPSLFGARHRLD